MSSYLDFDLEKGKSKLHIIQNLSRVFFTSLQELIESAPRVVDAVALDGDVVHQVPPLMLEQVFAAFQAVEQEVACAWGEMFRVVVPGAVELKRNVSVDADGEVVVHDVHRLQGRKVERSTCS